MHDMRITLDHRVLGQAHAADLDDPSDVVAPEVDQHQMLDGLPGVGQQLALQRPILLFGVPPPAGAGDGTGLAEILIPAVFAAVFLGLVEGQAMVSARVEGLLEA